MKKLMSGIALAAIVSASLFADVTIPGAQNMLRYSEPQLLTGAASSAGGALFDVTPGSVVNNPAVMAYEQRIVADVAGTLLLGSDNSSFIAQTGLTVPTRWGVGTALVEYIFADSMNLGNGINIIGSVAKDITEQLSIGMSLDFGYAGFTDGSDFKIAADMGAFYNFGILGPFQDVRFGGSLLHLGKMYAPGDGIKDMPGIATPKAGVAATLLSKDAFKIGASADISSPAFQDFVLDLGCQIELNKIITVSTSWEYDAKEFADDNKNIMPSISVSYKFRFNSKEGSTLANHGWAESDMTASGAWSQLYEDINAISAGCVLKLGQEDTQAPEIILWGEE